MMLTAFALIAILLIAAHIDKTEKAMKNEDKYRIEIITKEQTLEEENSSRTGLLRVVMRHKKGSTGEKYLHELLRQDKI